MLASSEEAVAAREALELGVGVLSVTRYLRHTHKATYKVYMEGIQGVGVGVLSVTRHIRHTCKAYIERIRHTYKVYIEGIQGVGVGVLSVTRHIRHTCKAYI